MNNYFIFSLFTKYSKEWARGAAWIARRPSNPVEKAGDPGFKSPRARHYNLIVLYALFFGVTYVISEGIICRRV